MVRSRKSLQLNYNHLHYFHVAAVEGSVGLAAQLLGVTQPTISEQLRTLERSLGVVLFERQSSGIKLTNAGRLTFRYTSVMFGAGEQLAEELAQENPHEAELLRIGVSLTIAREAMPDLLTPLLDIDHCVPSIRVADYVELARDLRANKLDILLTDFEPAKSERRGFDVRLVERTMVTAIGAVGLKPSSDWSDITLLHYRSGTRLRSEIDAFLASRSLKPRIAAEADDTGLLIQAATRCKHVAFVPRALAADAIESKRVVVLDSFESQHGLYALYQTGARIPGRAVERLESYIARRATQNANG